MKTVFEHKKQIFSFLLLFFSTIIFAQNLKQYKEEIFIKENDTLRYRILYPQNFSKDKLYPMILFLHGAGERGNDNKSQLIHGGSLFTNIENREKFPAIVLFPQCPKNDYWSNVVADRTTRPFLFKFQNGGEPTKSLGLVMSLLDDLLAQPFTKKNQVYVMGLSMGGMGTFEIISREPNTFAAAIPICGGGNPKTTYNYAKKTQLWIFHGAKDTIVNPLLSLEMLKSILKEGGNPNYTLYSNDNHNSWDSAFSEPNLMPWLFSIVKTKN